MNKINTIFPFTILLTLFFFISCNVNENNKNDPIEYSWENLIDVELTNWDKYLSFQHQVGYDGSPPVDKSNNEIEPIGLNKPGYNVFSTIKENDEILIKVSGEYYGALATKQEYENYHFQLKFKWGDKNGFLE